MRGKIDIQAMGSFVLITIESKAKNIACIITSPSGEQKIFMQPAPFYSNPLYSGKSEENFIINAGKWKYKIIFRPIENGKYILKLIENKKERSQTFFVNWL
jgi:hypothetical protein